MRILVTGSAGHLGEALVRTLQKIGHDVVGLDIAQSSFTSIVGSIADRACVDRCMAGVQAVLHTATLHKPHIVTHSRQKFIDTNITGTLNLLEAAAALKVGTFVYTSTTSVFGDSLIPLAGHPAVWITESVVPVPKNIYGVTKLAAENLCELFFRMGKLACIILRTSRFFPEVDDDPVKRLAYEDANAKINEYLHRRVDLQDAVDAHVLAFEKAPEIGFGRYIVSATTPFSTEDLPLLRTNLSEVVARYAPRFQHEYSKRGWKMFPNIDRVYVNDLARRDLAWRPRYDFLHILNLLSVNEDFRSPLARAIGIKGYHAQSFADGPYPVQ